MSRAVAIALFGCSMSLGCSASVLRPVVATDAARDLEQVTHGTVDETYPAVAPDAKALAYEAGPRVEVRSLVQPDRVIYDSHDTLGTQPAWMPDASSIIFTSGARFVQTFGQGVRPVFLADVGDPLMMGTATHPTVSPDGKLVAFSIDDIAVRKPGAVTRQYERALALTDLLGTGIKVIGHGTDPTFSPDGKQMAFVRTSEGHRHVFVARADGSSPTQITDGASNDESPTFSPEGDRVAYCSVPADGTAGEANLFTVHTDGSGLVQLTEGDRRVCHPSWGRDGFIYFDANVGHRFHIWRLRPGTA